MLPAKNSEIDISLIYLIKILILISDTDKDIIL